MTSQDTVDSEQLALSGATALLLRRGVRPESGGYSARQLAVELNRRGWRWQLDNGRAKATKAFLPSGTEDLSVEAEGANPVEALSLVLARAIRFDDEHGLSPTSVRADIVVRTPDDRTVALVEVKNRKHLTGSIAADIRGDLVSYSRNFRLAPFLLLVSQDRGFLWDQRSEVLPFAEATTEFPMDAVVARYLPWLQPGERAGNTELDFAVAHWLRDLATRDFERSGRPEEHFPGTAFIQAIRGASVEVDERL